MAIGLFVNGINQTHLLRNQSFDLEYVIGARGVFRGTIVDTSGAGFKIRAGDEIEFVIGEETVFFGTTMSAEFALLDTVAGGTRTEFDAVDEWAAASGRVVQPRVYTARTLKAIVTDIATLLTPWDIIIDPFMATGPTLTVTFDLQSIESAFQQLSELTGWQYRMRPDGVVEWFKVEDLLPLFVLTDADIRAGVKIRETRDAYRNRVWVLYGSGTVTGKIDTFTGDGSTRVFPLSSPAAVRPDQIYDFTTSAYLNVVVYGSDALFPWQYRASDNAIVQLVEAPPGVYQPPLAVGAQIRTTEYSIQYPLLTYAEDAPDIALHKPRESIEKRPEIFDLAQAQAYGAAVIRRGIQTPREATIISPYGVSGFSLPGDVAEVSLSGFDVASDWLITSVRASEEDIGDDGEVVFAYDVLEGTESRGSWVDFWRGRGGGSATSGGSASGTLIPAPTTGGGTGSGTSAPPMFLGGSSVEYVQSSGPTWVPSSAVRVTLDSAARGTTAAIVTARLRAAAGTVKARLFNVSDSVSAGESTVVTSTTWTDISFAVTLAVGSKVYQLEVLPSLSDAPVAAVGYVA